ncbi:MAG TPA: succinic semialdehyde dehydrogenase [Blastocatellia bacterium]|nr:succinic semialdehyde dehydrogenase [Blastocatellia bacterium]HMV82879.1 succinic semialdehyde dehydrogenase [Blastocatellia bacterium]HMX26580.1 succinic semialdehyde dehydrogenase [Blastocatellia bacterium]HMY72195.1 succinic semialdehyde dehydrogenase [Blastocatellia bacterium]HMZ21736.1 succinic semialdehyde dehydrogenase [Blastocatellia bacterium]
MAQRMSIEPHQVIEVYSPATLKKLGQVEVCSPLEVRAAVQKAREAFRVWSALDLKQRAEVLLSARDLFLQHREELIELICRENGKPRLEALVEITYVCDVITFYAKQGRRFLKPQRVSPHLLRNKKVTTIYNPRGVVGMITPWNFPLILTIGEAIPALMAGNAVVIKPSEWTPLIAERGAALLQQAFQAAGLPPQILQTVNGYGDTGGALVDEADMIAFTGSIRTGKAVAARAAQRLIPVSLELGGKDPMIVLRDADIERAANAAVWGAFTNSGQVCISVERVYVEEPIAEEFTRRVVEKTKALRQGSDVTELNTNHRVDVGAMTFPKQIETVEAHVADARAHGAQILTGGRRNPDLPGRFYEPTVLASVDHSMKIMTDETFGPVLPIMRVKNAEEALRLANNTVYGLNASVWTRDKSKGEAIAAKVEAGVTCVNDVLVGFGVTDAPSGGLKESGIGKRHGAEGIRRFCHQQVIVTDRFGMKRDPLWYPYDAQTERVLTRALGALFSSKLSAKLKSLLGK